MNFQHLQKIENYQKYLDRAIHAGKKSIERARRKVSKMRGTEAQMKQQQYFAIELITEIQKNLAGMLSSIYLKFPNLEALPLFYNELAKVTIRYNLTKQALGTVKWAEKQCREVSWKVIIAMKKAHSVGDIQKQKKAYFGRICSIMKQIQKHLEIIEESRIILKSWPDIKTDIRTIVIAGFPNVGKSSLLKALTGAKPEIKPYAFTTKSLNVGYMEIEPRVYQIIDTPGTFNRNLEEMNNVEKQAYFVLQHLAEKIVYVFDPSESCGYEVEQQLQLLKRLEKSFNKEVIIVINKVDLDTTKLHKIQKEYPTFIALSVKNKQGIEELKKRINAVR